MSADDKKKTRENDKSLYIYSCMFFAAMIAAGVYAYFGFIGAVLAGVVSFGVGMGVVRVFSSKTR